MMLTVEAYLKILEMTKPNASSPDVDLWLANAKRLETYVKDGVGDNPAKTPDPQTAQRHDDRRGHKHRSYR